VGCLSFAIFPRSSAGRPLAFFLVLNLVCLLVLLAVPALAAPDSFGPRAGSGLSGVPNQYGQVKRPYRRRQKQTQSLAEQFAAGIDYRLEAVAAEESLPEDAGADGLGGYVDEVGFCDLGEDCGCGSSIEPSCGCDEGCEASCGCEESCLVGPCGGMGWSVGFEWSFVKPRFSENVAFTTMDDDGANNSTFSDTEFDYDLELNPRVWLGVAINNQWGWRVSYWQFDHDPAAVTTSPNINTFGEITHPAFGDVDISTTIPTDTFTASSHLDAYTIDVEALKRGVLGGWQIGVGGGVRYASLEQSYSAQLRNTGNNLRGEIDFSHQLEGFGPTISLAASRPLARRVKLVCVARGSLLYGDGASRLFAREDVDLAPVDLMTTTRTTNREDLLPISEARIGLEWMSPKKSGSDFQWLLSTAMEGQAWGNAGNAASETADLGFFGFTLGAGFLR